MCFLTYYQINQNILCLHRLSIKKKSFYSILDKYKLLLVNLPKIMSIKRTFIQAEDVLAKVFSYFVLPQNSFAQVESKERNYTVSIPYSNSSYKYQIISIKSK